MTPDDVLEGRKAAYAMARSRGLDHHDAEDVAQDVAVRLLRRARLAGNVGTLSTFAAHNLMVDRYRRQRTADKHAEALAVGSTVDTSVEDSEALERARLHVRRAVDGLDAPEREAIVHTVLAGSRTDAAAASLGLRPNTVAVRAWRARRALRPALAHLVADL